MNAGERMTPKANEVLGKKNFHLTDCFDHVVMLTWSRWSTEMRSNRYHYAVRFARLLPVIFVQPFLTNGENYYFEQTEIAEIEILHITGEYGSRQTGLLEDALEQRGVRRPLLWIYNFNFIDYIKKSSASLRIYHATEDYLSAEFPHIDRAALLETLQKVDLLVSVSPGVRESYTSAGGYLKEDLLSPNGCDYQAWAPSEAIVKRKVWSYDPKTAFYQGNINRRIDFRLLNDVLSAMPDWEFRFCGVVSGSFNEWKELTARHRNLCFYGRLDMETMKDLAYTCSAGIIPFIQNELITRKYLPLKSFEYLAAGLPTVSTPLDSLREYGDLFKLASNTSEFIEGLEWCEAVRPDIEFMKKRLEAARLQDYDLRFDILLDRIQRIIASSENE